MKRVCLGLLLSCLLFAGCLPVRPETQSFLSCVRAHESGGDYGAVGSGYYGAYQFSQAAWDSTTEHKGWLWLTGVQPDTASAQDQDRVAQALYDWQGPAQWAGSGC